MAIGTAAAIGLGVVGIGSALGAKSANKASKRAAQVSADNNAENTALQREIYGQNKALLSPFVNRGNAAGDTINALLGLGGGQPQQARQQQVMPNALAQFGGGVNDFGGVRGITPFRSAASGYGIADGQSGLGSPYSQQNIQYAGQAATGGISPQQAADNAFDIYRKSSGYQFRLGEGMNALNSGYAGIGALQSGDAIRSAIEYGQNFGSGEFGNFLGYLGNQQGVGLSAGSAVAGVGQDYANNITAMNTQDAANQAEALLSKQNAFANTAGMLGGGLFNYATRRI